MVVTDQAIAVTSGGSRSWGEKLEPRRPMRRTTSAIRARGGQPPARNARDAQSPAIQSEPRCKIRSIAPRMANPRIGSIPVPADRSMTARLPNQQKPKTIEARLPEARYIPRTRIQPAPIAASAAGHRTMPVVGRPDGVSRVTARLGKT